MLLYDIDDAVKFVVSRTFLADDIVFNALLAKDEFLVGLEIADPDLCDWITREEIRAVAPEFFTRDRIVQGCCNTDHERQYIARRLSLNEGVVKHIVAADEAYMRQQGIMD